MGRSNTLFLLRYCFKLCLEILFNDYFQLDQKLIDYMCLSSDTHACSLSVFYSELEFRCFLMPSMLFGDLRQFLIIPLQNYVVTWWIKQYSGDEKVLSSKEK